MKQKMISTKDIWVILFMLLTGSLYAQTYMAPWTETYENRIVGDAVYEVSCKVSAMAWYKMNGSDYCFTAVSNAVPAREGTKYYRIWCTVPEGQCANLMEAYKAGGVFRGWEAGEGCIGMKWGGDYWVGWSQYIPENYYAENYRHMICQLKDSKDTGHPLWGLFSFDQKDNFSWTISGVASGEINVSWQALCGTWVDMVLHVVPAYVGASNSNSILEIYINGVQHVMRGANQANSRYINNGTYSMPNDIMPYFTPVLYNTGFPNGLCEECDTAIVGNPTPEFTREMNFDHFRMLEGAVGTYDYCDACPPIWSSAPAIISPTPNQTDVALNTIVKYTEYLDHRPDSQNCFGWASTTVQVDELGGDWLTPVFEDTIAGETSLELSGLEPYTQYQVRVLHKSIRNGTDETYDGEWSATSTFTTGNYLGVSEIKEQAGGLNMSIYPNPSDKNNITVKYELPVVSDVEITIIDNEGKIRNKWLEKERDSGVHRQEIDITGYPQGICYFKINADNMTGTKKIIVQ